MDQPILPKPWGLRLLLAAVALGLTVTFLALLVEGGQSPLLRLVALVAVATCGFTTLRMLRLGLEIGPTALVLRNLAFTEHVPLADVARFTTPFSLLHGSEALAVELRDGRVLRVDTFPMTRRPRVAAARRRQVEGLNRWLELRRAAGSTPRRPGRPTQGRPGPA